MLAGGPCAEHERKIMLRNAGANILESHA